jgi:hypothetical protein
MTLVKILRRGGLRKETACTKTPTSAQAGIPAAIYDRVGFLADPGPRAPPTARRGARP